MAQRFGSGAANIPNPEVSNLGGVMRNTGNAGQFVAGIDSNGALIYDTPEGTAIVRAQATLSGHTSADIPATAPPPLFVTITNIAQGAGILYTDFGEFSIVFDYTDPGGGAWVDISSGDPGTIANNLASVINGLSYNLSAYVSWTEVIISNINTGAAASLNYSDNLGNSISGGGNGTDDIPAGAEQSYATLIGTVSGKVIGPISVYYFSSGLGQVVYIIDTADGGQLFSAGLPDTGGAIVQAIPDFAQLPKWQNGCVGPLYFYFGNPTVGGSAQVFMIAELRDVLPYGTFMFYTCISSSYVAVYADGAGGTYIVNVESNSSSCGFGS